MFSPGNFTVGFDPTGQNTCTAEAAPLLPLGFWNNRNQFNIPTATKSTQPMHNGLTGGAFAHTRENPNSIRPSQ